MHEEPNLQSKSTAALAGSVATALVVNPFDVVRVRMQQMSALQHIPAQPKCCKDLFWYPSTNYCHSECVNPTTIKVFRDIVSKEGAGVLWRGVSLMLLQSIPANVIYFISYEKIRDRLELSAKFKNLGPLIAGGGARALSSTVVSPIELLKTRLQSLKVEGDAMQVAVKSVRDMVKEGGFLTLYKGLSLTLWRDVPFSSSYWLVVEAVRRRIKTSELSNSQKFCESFIAGITGGVVASVITTPFDVAKTRRQIGHSACSSSSMNMIEFMTCIVRTEGYSALFTGIVPRTLKVAPACAIMITSYEMGKRFLT